MPNTTTKGFGHDATAPAEKYRVWLPKQFNRDATRRAIIFTHGAGQTMDDLTIHEPCFQTWANMGFVVCAADLGGGHTWGNDDSIAAIDRYWAFLKRNYRVKSDKIVLAAMSMGGTTAFNWAHNNPTKIAAIHAVLPLLDLEWFYGTDFLGSHTEIDDAYGGHDEYLAALPTHSPIEYAEDLVDIPIQIHSSTNDIATPWDILQDFASITGAELISLGEVKHDPRSMDPFEPVEHLRFHALPFSAQ